MNTHAATDGTSHDAPLRSDRPVTQHAMARCAVAIAHAATRPDRLRRLAEAAGQLFQGRSGTVAWFHDRASGVIEGVWVGAAGQRGAFALEDEPLRAAGSNGSNVQRRSASSECSGSRDPRPQSLYRVLRHLDREGLFGQSVAASALLGRADRDERTVCVLVPDGCGEKTGGVGSAQSHAPCGETSSECAADDDAVGERPAFAPALNFLAEIVLAAEVVGADGSSVPHGADWFAADPSAAAEPPLPPDAALEALAEFAAGAGHEINNPVANIVGRAERLLRDESDPERRQLLAAVAAQAWRIRDMIGDLMLFARPPKPCPRRLSLRKAVDEAVRRLRDEPFAAETLFVVRPPGDMLPFGSKPDTSLGKAASPTVSDAAAPARDAHGAAGRSSGGGEHAAAGGDDSIVLADATQVAVVLYELLRNACEAAPRGPVSVCVTPGSHSVTVTVHTPEVTMTAHEWRRMFFPFFSARQAGRGLGFGLCKVWRIVNQHGGHIDIGTGPSGTTFSVHWPRGGSPAGDED